MIYEFCHQRLGKFGIGSRLKKVILSGCANITDATLIRLAMAQHQSLQVSRLLVIVTVCNYCMMSECFARMIMYRDLSIDCALVGREQNVQSGARGS